MKLDPHDTWIYYQLTVAIGTSLIALANIASAVYFIRYVRRFHELLKEIERSTRVSRTDVLLKRRALTLAKQRGTSVREQVELAMDEEEFRL